MSRDSGLGPVLGALYTGITRSVSPLPDRSGWGGRHFARVVSGRVFSDESGKPKADYGGNSYLCRRIVRI